MHPLGFLSAFIGYREPVAHVDAFDEQHAVLCLDLANGLDLIAMGIDLDLTRLQRAGEGAGQSAAGSSHYVVEGGGVGQRPRSPRPAPFGRRTIRRQRVSPAGVVRAEVRPCGVFS